jgi:RNA ligase
MKGNNFGTVRAIADRIASTDFDFGRVKVKSFQKYYLLCYTAEAQYGGDFTEIEKACRGLVIRNDGQIMALPMPKFFNLGEPQCPPLPDEPYTVWEKIDGSLAIFWFDGDFWRCNTKGSFYNPYTEAALEYWYAGSYDDLFPTRYTAMCEVVLEDDEMQRAVEKSPGLYLIAMRDNYSGKDVPLDEAPLELVDHAKPIDADIDTLLERKQEKEGVEGWVVRFESGFRVKIKTTWYLRIFRLIQSLTPKNIREMMLEAGEDWISEFPDDLRPEAVAIQEEIEADLQAKLERIYDAYKQVADIETRKKYALIVLDKWPDISTWLFRLRDGKFRPREVLGKMEL